MHGHNYIHWHVMVPYSKPDLFIEPYTEIVYIYIHMKKFAEVCLYNQCIIFIAAAISHVNINVY